MSAKAIVKICDCFCGRFRLLNKEKWVLFYKCNVKRVTFIKRFGRMYSEESQMELISFRKILISIGKISIFCRENRALRICHWINSLMTYFE